MNKRQSKKRKKYTHLIIGRYVYIKPSEWNKVKNKGNITQGRFIFSKLKEQNKWVMINYLIYIWQKMKQY